MKKYEADAGQHFASFAKELKEISEKKNKTVIGVFNDVEIEATKEKTIEEITNEYHEKLAANRKDWEQSEKGKEYKKNLEERKEKAQKELDQLMIEFKTVNKYDYKDLLKWIAKVQDYTDNSTLERPIKEIVDVLKEANYKTNENTGEDFIKGDRENEARYIIGQALSGLEGVVGAMHPMVATFAERWLKTYGDKEVVKVQVVQNVGIYVNGELELYARGTASDNYSRLVDFYEENMHSFNKEIKHMFISSYSEYWESEWGQKEMLPSKLETLQKLMDKEHDQIEPLTTKEFRKLIY